MSNRNEPCNSDPEARTHSREFVSSSSGLPVTSRSVAYASSTHCWLTEVSVQLSRQVAPRPLALRKAPTAAASCWL